MNNQEMMDLCMLSMKADTEAEVVQLLSAAGYWDDPSVWRYYGDYENNYNMIGNQQSRPEVALVEKLVNAVDARLMNECLLRGIDPEGPSAPTSIRQAVAEFFEDNPDTSTAGLIREWDDARRAEVARGTTFAATGARPKQGHPCFTISDCGEGQTPEMMPRTFLSLTRSNKLRIPFVQGKFNMGGTGVLEFCGRHNLQLILTRRNPSISDRSLQHPSDTQWGFTIVRREVPTGGRRNSVYTYLAPIGAECGAGAGGVLRFAADSMPIFPAGRNPYGRESQWGTLVKLYEYAATGHTTNILLRGGVLRRIDLSLPEVALPIRFHECRAFRGHKGSFETTLTGLRVRLEDDRAENLEPGFPDSSAMSVGGEQLTVTIYAFKKGKADTYRKNEGVVFVVNGQTHGYFPTHLFRRKRVGLSYLADSILVLVDCTNFSTRAREDLFMNSRDRLRGGELHSQIETALENMLRRHTELRALRERRRREEIESKLEDSKPLEEVLESLLRHSPTLSTLFLEGKSVHTPFKTIKVRVEEKLYEGERYPTFFKFKDVDYGIELTRDCHINMRCRISFETDAANDYLSRAVDPGDFGLLAIEDGATSGVRDYSLNLHNGAATLTLQLPSSCAVGDKLRFTATVTDTTRIESFENRFRLTVKPPAKPTKGGKTKKRKPPTDKPGDQRDLPSGIQLPKIIKVYQDPEMGEKGWEDISPHFDSKSALRVIYAGPASDDSSTEDGKDIYDFFVNVDNLYLKAEMKPATADPELTEARFVYGMVLLGLGLLHQDAQLQGEEPDQEYDQLWLRPGVEQMVEEFTKAAAPVLLPMIDYLGDLELENGSGSSADE